MAKTTVKDDNGVEILRETGYGHVTGIDGPNGERRNAHVTIEAEGLRLPVQGWADSTNPDIWEPVQDAHATGRRISFRIDIVRKDGVDGELPMDKVGKFDRFRRLVELKPAGANAAPAAPAAGAAANGSNGSHAAPPSHDGDPGPTEPGASPPSQNAPGPRFQEAKPWERTLSDGVTMNLGSYAVGASAATVEWAYELLVARRRETKPESPVPSREQVAYLAELLLICMDLTQEAIRPDSRHDRMDASHTRARGAVRTVVETLGLAWNELPANRDGVRDAIVSQAVMLLELAVKLDR
jgi:hypothetical protein